jgi:hypothetical protein
MQHVQILVQLSMPLDLNLIESEMKDNNKTKKKHKDVMNTKFYMQRIVKILWIQWL